MTWKKITADIINIIQDQIHAAGQHDPELCHPAACKTTTISDSNHLYNGHQYCNANNCDFMKERQPDIDLKHQYHDHSRYCDQFSCETMEQRHKSGMHQKCNGFCSEKIKSHRNGFHTFCDKSCQAKDQILLSHAFSTHSSRYCNFKTCPDIVMSHKTNHSLCRSKFCEVTELAHLNNDHSNCNEYWCESKESILHAHFLHTHSPIYCNPINCRDVDKSHQSDHLLCNMKNCDVVKERHESNKHGDCAPYWCERRKDFKKRFERWLRLDLGWDL